MLLRLLSCGMKMVFSWKEEKKKAIKNMKRRDGLYLRQGMNQESIELRRKIKRCEDALT